MWTRFKSLKDSFQCRALMNTAKKGGEFLDFLNYYQLFKKYSASWSSFISYVSFK